MASSGSPSTSSANTPQTPPCQCPSRFEIDSLGQQGLSSPSVFAKLCTARPFSALDTLHPLLFPFLPPSIRLAALSASPPRKIYGWSNHAGSSRSTLWAMGNLFAKCISSGSGSGDDSRSATHGYTAGNDVVPAQRREGHWPTPHPEEIVNSIVAVGGTEGGIESVSGDEDGAIKLCSWGKGTEGVVEGWKQPCAVNRLSHAKIGAKELFASGGRDGAVRVWRRGHPTPMHTLKGHELTVNGLATCPEAPEKICSGSRDWTVRVWDADAGSQVATVKVEWNVVSFMRWIKGSDCVLQASEDLQLRVWDIRSMARPAETIRSAHNNVMTCCDVSDDGNTLLSCSNGFDGAGCELKVWDRRKGELLCDLRGHTQTVTGCAFLPASLSPSPSSQSIVSSSQDSTVRTWNYTENKCVDNISIDSQHRVTSIAVSPETARLFTASFSGSLGSWAIGRGGLLSLASEANSGGSSLLSSGVTPS